MCSEHLGEAERDRERVGGVDVDVGDGEAVEPPEAAADELEKHQAAAEVEGEGRGEGVNRTEREKPQNHQSSSEPIMTGLYDGPNMRPFQKEKEKKRATHAETVSELMVCMTWMRLRGMCLRIPHFI